MLQNLATSEFNALNMTLMLLLWWKLLENISTQKLHIHVKRQILNIHRWFILFYYHTSQLTVIRCVDVIKFLGSDINHKLMFVCPKNIQY